MDLKVIAKKFDLNDTEQEILKAYRKGRFDKVGTTQACDEIGKKLGVRGDSLRSIFARMKKYGMLYISSGSLVEIETAGEFTPEQFKALQDVATWWKSKTGQSFVQPKDLKVHSIHLSKSLIVKSKREAKRRGISLSQFVNEAIAINIENEI